MLREIIIISIFCFSVLFCFLPLIFLFFFFSIFYETYQHICAQILYLFCFVLFFVLFVYMFVCLIIFCLFVSSLSSLPFFRLSKIYNFNLKFAPIDNPWPDWQLLDYTQSWHTTYNHDTIMWQVKLCNEEGVQTLLQWRHCLHTLPQPYKLAQSQCFGPFNTRGTSGR